MKKLKSIFFFAFIITLSFSCKKNDKYFTVHVSGKVFDGSTMTPVPNATVRLWNATSGYSSYTVTTDAQGHYSMEFRSNDNNSLQAGATGYVDSDGNVSMVPDQENVYNFNLNIYPRVYLDITVKMIDTAYDYMSAASFLNKYSYPHVYLQKPADTLKHLILYKRGGTSNTFNIQIQKSDAPLYTSNIPYAANFQHTVFCSASDTTYYTIQY